MFKDVIMKRFLHNINRLTRNKKNYPLLIKQNTIHCKYIQQMQNVEASPNLEGNIQWG